VGTVKGYDLKPGQRVTWGVKVYSVQVDGVKGDRVHFVPGSALDIYSGRSWRHAVGSYPDDVDYTILGGVSEPALTGGSSSYYKLPEGATDLADIIEARNMNFNEGNMFKAVYRLGRKPGTTVQYDIDKIRYFLDREEARLKREGLL
jgi:hypothetical protein